MKIRTRKMRYHNDVRRKDIENNTIEILDTLIEKRKLHMYRLSKLYSNLKHTNFGNGDYNPCLKNISDNKNSLRLIFVLSLENLQVKFKFVTSNSNYNESLKEDGRKT
ncbi:hypothetical protein RCL_jg26017.t2 [Rhizophagus clarus]|uniref:Uncharacterized protein n=1 Tax=Rhizophagus clarus TaxID=94130 RepID=A0A8H3QFI7_9GLOM|nr:hypothetical protein RCL_jg26017.t2 [Rhizophagus clarus]